MSPRPIPDDAVRRALLAYYGLASLNPAIQAEVTARFTPESTRAMRDALEEYEAHRAMRATTQQLRDAYAAAEASDAA